MYLAIAILICLHFITITIIVVLSLHSSLLMVLFPVSTFIQSPIIDGWSLGLLRFLSDAFVLLLILLSG